MPVARYPLTERSEHLGAHLFPARRHQRRCRSEPRPVSKRCEAAPPPIPTLKEIALGAEVDAPTLSCSPWSSSSRASSSRFIPPAPRSRRLAARRGTVQRLSSAVAGPAVSPARPPSGRGMRVGLHQLPRQIMEGHTLDEGTADTMRSATTAATPVRGRITRHKPAGCEVVVDQVTETDPPHISSSDRSDPIHLAGKHAPVPGPLRSTPPTAAPGVLRNARVVSSGCAPARPRPCPEAPASTPRSRPE